MAGKQYIIDMFPELSIDNKVDSVLFFNGCKALISIYGKKILIIEISNFLSFVS